MDRGEVMGDVMPVASPRFYACYHPGSNAGYENWSVLLAWTRRLNMRGVSLMGRTFSTCMTGVTLARQKRLACRMCGTRFGRRVSEPLHTTTHQANGYGTLIRTNHPGGSRNE